MAESFWSRIKETDGYLRARLFIKRMRGREPRLQPDTEVNLWTYGRWSLCPDLLISGSVLYSIGLGDNIDFEIHLIESLGVEVHAFDPTPGAMVAMEEPSIPENFHFHPWATAERDGSLFMFPLIRSEGSESKIVYTIVDDGQGLEGSVEVSAFTPSTIMKKLGHAKVDVLKMDVEGAEYSVLKTLIASGVRPIQVLIEFHHRFEEFELQQTLDAVDELRGAGYGLIDISPTGREFSFLKPSALA